MAKINHNILILGGGSWGTTISRLLSEKIRKNIFVYEHNKKVVIGTNKYRENKEFLKGYKLKSNIKFVNDFEKIDFKKINLILIIVPVQYIRNTLKKLKNKIHSKINFINFAKGFEINTQYRVSEIVQDVLNININKRYFVLSGPTHAEEVCNKKPTAVVLAGKNKKKVIELQELFLRDYFRVYSAEDYIGVEMGGAIKNIIAIAAGICDGLHLGDNTKATLISRGLVEITKYGQLFNINPLTFFGLSGLADLITTCMSSHSRNRYVGEQIALGRKLDDIINSMSMVAEGVSTTKAVYGYMKKHKKDLPITEKVYKILYSRMHPSKAIKELMRRSIKPELDINTFM